MMDQHGGGYTGWLGSSVGSSVPTVGMGVGGSFGVFGGLGPHIEPPSQLTRAHQTPGVDQIAGV